MSSYSVTVEGGKYTFRTTSGASRVVIDRGTDLEWVELTEGTKAVISLMGEFEDLKIQLSDAERSLRAAERALKVGHGFGDATLDDWKKLEARAVKAEAELKRQEELRASWDGERSSFCRAAMIAVLSQMKPDAPKPHVIDPRLPVIWQVAKDAWACKPEDV